MKFKQSFFILLLFAVAAFTANAQDPQRFDGQVKQLSNAEYNFNPQKDTLVFAGSSSIRMWKNVQEYFPEYNVINNGFGGSHFSDLIHFYDELIKKWNPDILFIYEGDNDVAAEKKPAAILKDAKKLHQMIRQDFPKTKIVFIAAKPSIARWHFKSQYENLNNKLKKFAGKKKNTAFADVWTAMLDENGQVYDDVFIEDDLHMNKKGYDIWAEVISNYLENE